MKLINYFASFLDNEVNLNPTRVALLDQRVEAITNFIKADATFSDSFLDTIAQGSYAHKTIIRPVQERHEFDADVLLYLEENPNWTAAEYVENLYTAFRASSVYRSMVSRRTRCVVINYAGDFHIDVVPYMERHDSKYITNRREDRFELTDPKGYNAWLEDKNRTACRHLVKAIRLIKYLRDFKGTFAIKSVILNVLLGNQVLDAALLTGDLPYADVPTTLRSVMNRLGEYVDDHSILPAIIDPGGTGDNLSDRWDQVGYSNFRKWIIYYAEKIDAAYLEPDKSKSLKLWQDVFGPSFQQPKLKEVAATLTQKSLSETATFRNTEQSPEDIGIAVHLDKRYTLRLTGRVLKKSGFRDYNLADAGNKVLPGRNIRFAVSKCTVPTPYDIYWKVKNNGTEATKRDCIRGQIEKGGEVWRINETTSFRGSHYVECFIVKNGVCVAYDRQAVLIF